MDSSEEVQSISEEASSPLELKKGMSIFLDVSRLCLCTHYIETLLCFFYYYRRELNFRPLIVKVILVSEI